MERNHQRLAFVLDASQLALWDWDMVSGDLFIDSRWAQMLGYEKEELEPVTIGVFRSLLNPLDEDRVFDSVDAHSRGEQEFFETDFRLAHKAGHWVWIRSRGLIVQRLEDGTPSRMTGVHEDITELRSQQRELQVKSSQLEAAQRLGRIGSWYWDLATDEVTWSHELFVMQGFDPDSAPPLASEHARLFTEDSWEKLAAAQQEVATKGTPYELELEMEQGNGPIGWMLTRGEAALDEFGEIVGVFGIAQDITARKHTEERLRTMAMQDELSLLGNRAALNSFLDLALDNSEKNGTRVGCVMIDLDNFKQVNDTLGHLVGDKVIQIAANRLARLTRKSDTAFRLGGDEFVVVLESVKDQSGAQAIGERIVEAFHTPITLDGKPITVNASVGIAFSENGANRSDILRKADAALYQSKRTGKNRSVIYSPDLADSDRYAGA